MSSVIFVLAFAELLFGIISYQDLYGSYKGNHAKLTQLRSRVNEFREDAQVSNELLAQLESRESFYRLKYGVSEIDSGIRKFSTGGKPTTESLAETMLGDMDMIQSGSIKTEFSLMLDRVRFTDSILDRLHAYIDKELSYYREIPSIWPVKKDRISSAFGNRVHPVYGRRIFHEGIDIVGTIGDSVIAPADGVCTYVGVTEGYGKMIEVRHRNSGYYTRYAHLSGFNITEGEIVKRGDLIGFLGNTGTSTGPHLHYEVRNNDRWGKALNPYGFLPGNEQVVYD
ncbi:MAG: M23 family metallopeptidase [Fibrobacterota bacterium]